MRRRVVFVASAGHSGSTVLDLILGGNPDVVGLGEIHAAILYHRDQKNPCTCGREARQCAIWGPLLRKWELQKAVDPRLAYQEVLGQVEAIYGPDKVIVDSSKHIKALKAFFPLEHTDFRVLFLIRDVRGYAISTRRRSSRTLGPIGRSTLFRTLQWYRLNLGLQRFLRDQEIPYFQFGYEELCLSPGEIMPAIGRFLEIRTPSVTGLQKSNSHILRGNRMRFDDARRQRLAYDFRWFHSRGIQLAAMSWPPVWRWNTLNTYRNIGRGALDEADRENSPPQE